MVNGSWPYLYKDRINSDDYRNEVLAGRICFNSDAKVSQQLKEII